jgi:HPt (histidine-containing phosphotransfer) domain-containing protein
MIDWQKYNDTFQWYGEDVEIELIEVFQGEFESRMAKIATNVAQRDYEQLRFNVHSLKGTVANYHDPVPVELAKELEQLAKQEVDTGLDDLLARLTTTSMQLLEELLQHRTKLLAAK